MKEALGFRQLCRLGIIGAGIWVVSIMSVAPASAQTGSGCILDNCADQKPLPQPSATPQNGAAPPSEAPAPSSGATAPSTDTTAPSSETTETDQQSFRRSGPQPGGPSAPGDFDFYVLALSWSPGFCDTGGAEKARAQCADGANLGFVVHGLWPQYEHGFPSDCGRGGWSPSWIALQNAQGLYPDIGLARYEWRKHGTCSGKSPTDYFADVRRARDAITIPDAFQQAHDDQTWTPLDIQRAFIAANPRLRPGMMAVQCNQGELEEVRICFSKDLRNFVSCPEVSRHFCYTQQITVPGMR